MKRRRALALCLGCLCMVFLWPVREARGESLSTGARGAALIEASSGRILYESHGNDPLPMASTTKIMTALIALERGDLQELIPVPREAEGTEGSSMYLTAGERLSLEDLLYGLMLTSGNDAAVAIALYFGGSLEGFAALMNDKARELGCADTHFVTPHGLHDPEHYTTALDLCRIARAAMETEAFAKIVSTQYHKTSTGSRVRTLKNKNKTLWSFEGGCGIKTGFTKKAGRCLVFAARRAGMLLIGTVLNCPDMWQDAFSMLRYGFDTYALEPMVDASRPLCQVEVTGSDKKALPAVVKTGILYPIRKDGSDRTRLARSLPTRLAAPIEAGQRIGQLTLYVNDVPVLTREILAAQSAAPPDFLWYFKKMAASFF
jgi:D-alanyl-D-alanine carboxypeptidase (penicillin-binding protein 5/6)